MNLYRERHLGYNTNQYVCGGPCVWNTHARFGLRSYTKLPYPEHSNGKKKKKDRPSVFTLVTDTLPIYIKRNFIRCMRGEMNSAVVNLQIYKKEECI